jgi:integrase
MEDLMASVRKRVRTGVNGSETVTWTANYRDQDRRQRLKTFTTKKAAEAWLLATRGDLARGVHTPERTSITVAQAATLWLDHNQAEGRERGTLRSYDQIVRLHIAPTIGPAKLATLSTPALEGWRDRLVAGCSRSRARKVLTILKAILKEAQRRGLTAQNVALPVVVGAAKRDEDQLGVDLPIPGKAQIQQLLTTVSEAPWRHYRPLLITAIFTGMRASELRGLAWSAVDFAKRTITVRQRADEWGAIGKPKSKAGKREIPMSPMVVNTLRAHKLACPPSDLDLVFPSAAGTPLLLTNLTRRFWRPLQRAAGLVDAAGDPLFNFHMLRHYAASSWIEQGFSPKRLQALLGHASITMTYDVYGHLFPSTEDDHEKFAAAEIDLVA